MTDNLSNQFRAPKLSKKDFQRIGGFIQSNFGIKMPDSKRMMIESRLRKRLKSLGIDSYSEYCDYLFSQQGQVEELQSFIDVVTTNKTDFFREPDHFTYLSHKALPQLADFYSSSGNKTFNVWSSACSKGDEPYTLAMVINEFVSRRSGYDFKILATDISTQVLNFARKGVYPHTNIDPVPMGLRKKYLLKSKNQNEELVRIIPALREKIIFKQLNLIEGDFQKHKVMDIIFCRNVIIYFDHGTSFQLVQRLCNKLRKGGYLFMGHSELLDCNALPLKQVAPTIYQRL